MNWDIFLAPYTQTVDELKIKLKGMRKQFDYESRHSPIEFVTGRVKPITSIIEKAKRRGIPLSKMEEEVQDIAGLRVVCPFVEDIYEIVELIRERQDFEIIEEKDYIEKNKESGYRSYHIVIRYPVETIYGVKNLLAEIQIRTLAMNFGRSMNIHLIINTQGNCQRKSKQDCVMQQKQLSGWMKKCQKSDRKSKTPKKCSEEKRLMDFHSKRKGVFL